MAVADKDQVFTALAIRDTTIKTSGEAVTGEFTAETIVVINGLDQDVTIQLQGSHDKTTWFNLGDSFVVLKTDKDFETVTNYFPFYRLTGICGVSPTTGVLDAWILKSGAVN